MLGRSRAVNDFCTRRIASLLEASQRAVQSDYALAQVDENRFSRPVRSLIRQAPLSVGPDTTTGRDTGGDEYAASGVGRDLR
ncbi:MAG TPA: hypothetical protein PLE48_13070 [Thiobacillus sp.]|nr:hypothetical protein [Thiobacillus sp.]HQT71339.1 hypothetical protein [Thiobacillus sp.]